MNNQKTDTITYITSPEGLTAIVVASSNTAGREWYWVFTDHLGSITNLIRNSDGQKYEMSYDAWGNRRDPATWETYTSNMPTFITDRGYTGHEHLDEFFLINMNGRMYDPLTTRFLSPDPVIADPGNPAGYNPYAYVLNNPLKYTDPSGYFVDPVSITAYIIAGAIIYSSYAKQNADPKTGKWDWNFTNWVKKDRPGFTIGTITNTSFTSTTFFVSANFHNGTNSTFGYNTQFGWGTGNSPQDMYFPNHNSGTSEAAAVNSIASSQGTYNYMANYADNYMDNLAAKTMRGYGGIWLPGVEVVWNGNFGSGILIGELPGGWRGSSTSGGGGNWFSDIWNSSLARVYIPDVYYFNFSGSLVFLGGGGADIGLALPMRGEDSGKLYLFGTLKGKAGLHGGVSFNVGRSNYIGPAYLFDFDETFGGLSNHIEADYILGVSISSSQQDKYGNTLFSGDFGIGPGVGGSAGIGKTYVFPLFNFW